MNKKGDLIPFPQKRDDEEGGIILKIRRLLRVEPKAKVTVLVPKDIRDKFENIPRYNGKEISSHRDLISYFFSKKNDEEDELYEFYNKINPAWLGKEEYSLFMTFYSRKVNWDYFAEKIIAYENSAVNQLRSVIDSGDKKEESKATTKYYFAKLMVHLSDERERILK